MASAYIARHDRAKQEEGFDALRHEGIQLLQQYSGELWTDYNLHDPGVTILEHLIYGITDLNYRANFDVADFLSMESGEIDYTKQALYLPEDIFPCRPVTLQDYEAVFLNAIPEIDNVWILPNKDAGELGCNGLYSLEIKLKNGLVTPDVKQIKQKAREVYRQNRNLCEDLAEVNLITTDKYSLCGEIQISENVSPVEVMALVYFHCIKQTSAGYGLPENEQDALQQLPLETLFDGPVFGFDTLLCDQSIYRQELFDVSILYSAVNQVEGVTRVRELYLEKENEGNGSSIDIAIPTQESDVKLRLTVGGRSIHIPIEALQVRIEELLFRYQSSGSLVSHLAKQVHYQPPTGFHRPTADYNSIQEHFPTNYGIGIFGMPESATDEEKGRAKQLKGYLVVFEQLMANFLQNIDSIAEIYSPEIPANTAYPSHALTPKQVPGLAALYSQDADVALKQILTELDNGLDRKSRVLDYMLALYGEKCPQDLLFSLHKYHSRDSLPRVGLKIKAQLLQSIADISRHRGGGCDYHQTTWHSQAASALHKRVSILSGFQNLVPRPLTRSLLGHGLTLVNPFECDDAESERTGLQALDQEHIQSAGFLPVEQTWQDLAYSIEDIRRFISDSLLFGKNSLSHALLQQGVQLSRYRLGHSEQNGAFQLVFVTDDQAHWLLGHYESWAEGTEAANALCQFLIQLNQESEGLHIVEHLMLRPLCAPTQRVHDADFYSFQISVVLPGWTARTSDIPFRGLVEKLVCDSVPAHIYPHFFWLDFDTMYQFEGLFENWLSLNRGKTADSNLLDEAAADVVRFLIDQAALKGAGSNDFT